MACDESIMSCVNQDEQPLASWADQENQTLASWDGQADVTTNGAQSVDDQSSRNENLQNVSETVQHNAKNAPECRETTSVGDGRELLNSEIGNFVDRTYITSYKLPVEDAAFKSSNVVPFNVEYSPKLKSKSSKSKLTITMPVKFVGFTDRNLKTKIKNAYSESVNRVWSGKYRMRLKVNSSAKKTKGKSCDAWAKLSPAVVEVFVKDVQNSNTQAYEIYYQPRARTSTTTSHTVTFNERAYKDRYNKNQNVFAHEFGHQIGLDDEYAINYDNGDATSNLNNVNAEVRFNSQRVSLTVPEAYVYWASQLRENKFLDVFERTEYKRQYTLPRQKALFNHGGVDYFAEERDFDYKGKVRRGFILRKIDGEREELDKPLSEKPGSTVPVVVTDSDGRHYVYFYGKGMQEVKLKAVEDPGPRSYDLDKFFTMGAKIYHNFKEYSVGRGIDRQNVFYFLMRGYKTENGRRVPDVRGCYLDGAYTTHFAMAAKERTPEYAQKNATMFEMDDITHKRQDFRKNDKNLMNIGNVVKPHYYAPFKKGMVAAIQSDSEYGSTASPKAPNVEEDWKIG